MIFTSKIRYFESMGSFFQNFNFHGGYPRHGKKWREEKKAKVQFEKDMARLERDKEKAKLEADIAEEKLRKTKFGVEKEVARWRGVARWRIED